MTAMAAMAVLCSVIGAATPAAASPPVSVDLKGDARIQALEERLLGPEHAAEHRSARASERKELGRLRTSAVATQTMSAREVNATLSAQAVDSGTDGKWTTPFQMPAIGVHSLVLPTGKVLFYSQKINNYSGVDAAAYLWDPAKAPGEAGEFKSVTPPVNIWCGGQSLMADGQVLVTGGNLAYSSSTTGWRGLKTVFTFNPWTETWTRQPDMPRGRWYPTQTLLPDGRTLITSGYDDQGNPTTNREAWNTDIDVFNPPATRGGQGSITTIARYGVLPGSPQLANYYPHWFVMPSGRVLNAGYNTRDSWLLTTTPGAVAGLDVPNWAQYRRYGSAVLMPDSPSGSTRVMQIGGYDHTSPEKASVASSEVFDEATPAQAPVPGPSMRVPRSHQNTVLLPDRSMINVGGGSGAQPGTEAPDNADNALAAAGPEHKQIEIMDAGSNTWRLGPSQIYKRAYHSTAMLLPDGRVLSAGDDRDPAKGASYREKDFGEIYEPAYLHKPGVRPSITTAPSTVTFKQRFSIETTTAIESAVLIAPAATTHANDMHQRLVPLAITPTSAGAELVAPPDANVAPPGYYMLFALSPEGKPSIASWVRLGGNNAPPADTTAPTAPANLEAVAGDGFVSLTWAASPSTDTNRYDVYRIAPGTRIKVGSTSVDAPRTLRDTNVSNGSAYSYVVRAVDGAGNESADSASVSATPSAGGTTRTVTLSPVADTNAKQQTAATAYGSAASLEVDAEETNGNAATRANGYLRFAIDPLASNETITAASLSLQVTNSSANGPQVWRTAPAWSESALTWNSGQPARSGTAAVGNFASMSVGRRSTPVSGITSGGDVSFQLYAESTDGLDFASREDATAGSRPQLSLTISTSGGTSEPPSGDTTAPTVTSRGPAAGATDVAVSTNVTASFSEAVQGVSDATFVLRNASTGALVGAALSAGANANQYVLDPSADLTAGTQYTVTLTGGSTGIRDSAGNPLTTTSWSFSTAATTGATRTVTLNPVADTNAKQQTAITNYGTAAFLESDSEETNGNAATRANAYLRFTIDPLAANETITAANLSLLVTNSTINGPQIWKTEPTWTESAMTWSTGQPARIGTAPVGNFVGMGTGRRGTPVSGITADGNVSFQLFAESTDGLDFASRENATAANRPQLILTIRTS